MIVFLLLQVHQGFQEHLDVLDQQVQMETQGVQVHKVQEDLLELSVINLTKIS